MHFFKKLFVRNKKKFIITASALMFLYSLTILYYVLVVIPVSNDECLWLEKRVSKDSVFVYIDKVKVGGVTWTQGIRNGDHLLKINNVPIKNNVTASFVLNKMKAGEHAEYELSRDGKVFHARVLIKKLIDFGNLGVALLGFIWMVVGFIVIMAKPDGYVQKLFYRTGNTLVLCSSYVFIKNVPFSTAAPLNKTLWIIVFDTIWSYGVIMTPFLLAHFFMVFPKPFRIIEKKWVKRIFYIVPLSLVLLSFLSKGMFLYFRPNDKNFMMLQHFLNNLFLGGIITGLILLLVNFFRLKEAKERKPVTLIVISYVLGVLSIVYTIGIANVIADTIFNSPELFTPIILVALLPVAFAYSIFKYQLLDVSVVIKNAVVYGTATVAIAGLYFLIVYGLGQSVGSFIGTDYRNAIAALSFVVFAMIFQSTKDRFQDLLTRKFYPEQFAYQQVILKFGNDVMSIMGQDNILESMNKTFPASLGLKHFAILLNNDNNHAFKVEKGTGIKEDFQTLSHDGNLTHFVREKLVMGIPVVLEQQEFKLYFPSDYEKLIENEIFTIVPMVSKSRTIGLMLFGLKLSGSQFAGKDLEILCAAAGQAAVSIENARMYESEAQRLAFQRDLENARKIQESLLPKTLPRIDGLDIAGIMIPAMQVGGDYYDVIQVAPGKVFIIVGDVSGKGLSASLYMSKLQTMMRLYCRDGKTPKEILVEVNKKIYESIERNWFITVNLALFDLNEKSILFCRAGHSPMMSICSDSVKEYQPKGIGIGLEEGRIFAETIDEIKIPIGKGFVYIFYSDGISEAMNAANEMLGTERMSVLISKHQGSPAVKIIDSLIAGIQSFRGSREQNDDITAVVVKT